MSKQIKKGEKENWLKEGTMQIHQGLASGVQRWVFTRRQEMETCFVSIKHAGHKQSNKRRNIQVMQMQK